MIWDAIVLGGGPAGGMAAYELARGGARVLLLEKSKVPRFKLCSGVLSGYSQDIASSLLGDDLGGSVIGGAGRTRVAWQSGGFTIRHHRLRFVDRARFDAAILGNASSLGSVVRDGCKVLHAGRVGAEWHVSYATPGGGREMVYARNVVEARGSEAPLSATLQRHASLAVGVEARIPYVGSNEAIIDWSLPGGYFWLFPKFDGTAGVGGGTTNPKLWPTLRRMVTDFWAERGMALPKTTPGHHLRYSLGPVARNGLYLVGEAAGAQDPAFGEGIRWALESGRLAGRLMLVNNAEDAYVKAYNRRVRREIALRHTFGTIGSKIPLRHLWSGTLRAPIVGPALIGHFLG